MRTLTRSFALVALVLAAVACGSRRGPARMEVPTTLRVENQAFSDMNIYVVQGGQRVRLGTANGNSTTRFRIPANLIFGPTSLRFIADPIGGRRSPVSDEITVSPGDEVGLVIPPS